MSFHLPGITAALTSVGTLNVDRLWWQPQDFWLQSHSTHIPILHLPSYFADAETFYIEFPPAYKIQCDACKNDTTLWESGAVRFGAEYTYEHFLCSYRQCIKAAHEGLVCNACREKKEKELETEQWGESMLFEEFYTVNVQNLRNNILAVQVIKRWKAVTRSRKIQRELLVLQSADTPLRVLPSDILVQIVTHANPVTPKERAIWHEWSNCTDTELEAQYQEQKEVLWFII